MEWIPTPLRRTGPIHPGPTGPARRAGASPTGSPEGGGGKSQHEDHNSPLNHFWLKSPELGFPLSSITCRCPCRVMVAPIGSQRLRAEALRLILAAFLFVFIFLSRATLCVAQFIFFFTLAWMFKVMAVFVRALWYCHVGATIDIGL